MRVWAMRDFLGIDAKIQRADDQIQTLAEEMDVLRSKIKLAVKREIDNEDADKEWWIYRGEPVGERTASSIRIGEILHNLRSSLDYHVWQLVLANGQKPGAHNAFPISDGKDKWEKALSNGRLKGVGEEARKTIHQLQPFAEGEGLACDVHPFSALRNLSNIDKHRHLHLCMAFPIIRNGVEFDVPQWPPDTRMITGKFFVAKKMEPGTRVACSYGSRGIPRLCPFEVVICIDDTEHELVEGDLSKFEAAPTVLKKCLDAVRKADRLLRDQSISDA